MWGGILQLAQRGQIRPVVGRRIGFDDIPSALEAIERRETTGKTVARPRYNRRARSGRSGHVGTESLPQVSARACRC